MLRILLAEDSPNDALLVRAEVEKTFGEVILERVDAPSAFAAALETQTWDVILADHKMPGFSALGALKLLQRSGHDIPFIIVSGSMGEDLAVAAMKAGAHDYVTKRSLSRLGPAIEREMRDAFVRAERTRSGSLLREAQQRLATVLESTQDRVFTFDCELRVTGIYGSWLREEGRSPEEFVGRTPAGFVGEAGGEHEPHFRRAIAGENAVYEWSRDDGPGPRRHFQTVVSPLRNGAAVTGGVGITREITRLKQMEGQLVMAERMVSIGTLAASVAHEINNPLACVLANLAVALDAAAGVREPEVRRDLLEPLLDAKSASERVRNVVQDLRILSRGDEDRIGPVDVRKVLDAAVRLGWNEVRHRAHVEREFAETPPVRASESRLGQVFLNLVVNAAQAMPEGSAETNRIVLRTRSTVAGEVVAEIEDTGCGMPPHVVERLFTPFFTTKPPGIGTGLGLSISQRIVTELGGRIEVTSEAGRGSVFRVVLPADTRTADVGAGPPAPTATPAPRRARILVVDDDEHVGTAIRRTLREHEVSVADGPGAVARIEGGESFDLVLCDLMMPVMSGMQVHARIRSRAPELAKRMIFMSGGAFTPATQEFLKERPHCVQKPFDSDDLRRIVNEALA